MRPIKRAQMTTFFSLLIFPFWDITGVPKHLQILPEPDSFL
jgi:hypothetical protein